MSRSWTPTSFQSGSSARTANIATHHPQAVADTENDGDPPPRRPPCRVAGLGRPPLRPDAEPADEARFAGRGFADPRFGRTRTG